MRLKQCKTLTEVYIWFMVLYIADNIRHGLHVYLKNPSIGRGEVFKSYKAMMTFILTTISARFFDVVTISHQFEIYYSFSFIKIFLEQIAQLDK